MSAQESTNRGPIWRDVSELIVSLTSRWGGVWVVSIRPDPSRGRSGHLCVLCERTVALGGGGAYRQTRASGAYPSSDGRSFPALVFGLLYELDAKLETDSELAARQTSF